MSQLEKMLNIQHNTLIEQHREVRSELQELRKEFRQEAKDFRDDMRNDMKEFRNEMKLLRKELTSNSTTIKIVGAVLTFSLAASKLLPDMLIGLKSLFAG